MRLVRLRQSALMWGIRVTPLPWRIKRLIIWRLTPRQLVAAFGLIPDEHGRLLLVRTRYSGRWILPGGAVQPGELPLEGLRRECREELGHEVAVVAFVGFDARRSPSELILVYRCAPLTGAPYLSPEHDAYRYVERSRLPLRLQSMFDRIMSAPHF